MMFVDGFRWSSLNQKQMTQNWVQSEKKVWRRTGINKWVEKVILTENWNKFKNLKLRTVVQRVMRANLVKDKKIWFRYLLQWEEGADLWDNTEEIPTDSGNWLSAMGEKSSKGLARMEWGFYSVSAVEKVLCVRVDKSREEMETLVFIFFNWEGGQRVSPSENRKKCGTWWGQGSMGKSFTKKLRRKTWNRWAFQGRKKMSRNSCLEGALLNERKEKQCQKDTVSKGEEPRTGTVVRARRKVSGKRNNIDNHT